MAAFIPDAARTRVAATLLCGLAAGAALAATPQLPRPSKDQPIELVAASSDFDYKKNTLVFRQLRITQGPLVVEAQSATATGLNFENSDWTLSGQVRITVPDGKLTSSDAKVAFRNNQISSAQVRGSPAEFEQRVKETGQIARGRARAATSWPSDDIFSACTSWTSASFSSESALSSSRFARSRARLRSARSACS